VARILYNQIDGTSILSSIPKRGFDTTIDLYDNIMGEGTYESEFGVIVTSRVMNERIKEMSNSHYLDDLIKQSKHDKDFLLLLSHGMSGWW
jgi:hypothetical protein